MKNNKKKGFTLMELLIVIAIIAVLVAIAIPTFTSQLEKAREAADAANIRAAYAEVSVAYLADGDENATKDVDATQKQEGWQSDIDKIGGIEVAAETLGGWTVAVTDGEVTITENASA